MAKEQVRHVFVISDVEAALYAAKTKFIEDGTYISIGLLNPSRVMLFCIGHNQIKGNGIH